MAINIEGAIRGDDPRIPKVEFLNGVTVLGFLNGKVVSIDATLMDLADMTIDHLPYIGEDYYVYVWNKESQGYVKTEIYVKGEQGEQGPKGETGEQGEQGPKGDNGTSVRIVGKRDTKANLPKTWSVLGDGFITEDTGHLHVWDGSGNWLDVGKIQGDTSYFHVKYSDDGGETFTSNNGEDLGSWMGTYVDFIEEDSDDPTDYKWIRVEGVKGDDGANYLPMGEWDPETEYQKTLMGIPLVKVMRGTNFDVYTLHLKEGVSKNVKPWESFSGENRHWDLANSIPGLTYMERAYAERLQAEIIDTVLLNADTVQAELITAEKIEALNINARKVVSEDNMGNMIASMNIAGDGAYIQYYPSGNKMMEFNGGVITYYENNEDNTVLWTLGRAGAIISGNIDRWQVITLTATNELGSGIKQPYIDGVQWRVFVPGSPSSWGEYRGLTITNDSFNYDNPSNIPPVAYIPNGWYTISGSAPMIIDEGYYREIVYYQSGYKTNSTKIITF